MNIIINGERGYRVPKRSFESFEYNNLYEQMYFQENTTNTKKNIKKKSVKKNKTNLIKKILYIVIVVFLLFFVLPYSFDKYIRDIFPHNPKKMLKIDYYKLLFPTHGYLYKDLFLGKYIIKDTKYGKSLMTDIKETTERYGLKARLLSLANEYSKIQPSIYVWEYNNGTYVDINADEAYPAASIIKIPVLIEMFREIESGKFSLYDTMVLDDHYRAPGSGKLQYSQGGISHTMDKLARIMIENSDNSATNMIIAKIGGMPEVNRAIQRWGIKTTHIYNWLPDMGGTNITTAREMARMFYNIDTTNILNQSSKRKVADYLSHVKNNRLLQAGLPSDAILLHKTGDIGFMLGDAGIVKTSTGKKYIVVILVKRPYNHHQGKEFIVKASDIIYNNML